MNLDSLSDDGLSLPDVGRWAETKYGLVSYYDELFSTAMRDRWGTRVYIDLYSGAGYAQIKSTNRVVPGSPLLALAVPHPFDTYVFCESNAELLKALRQRIEKHFPKANVHYVEGDCNDRIDEILALIPSHSRTQTVLSFCFVDPREIDIRFSTIRKPSQRFVDFLVLLALFMDANRNVAHYTSLSNHKVDEFLGSSTWRSKWAEAENEGGNFPHFLAEEYARRMQDLGYIPPPLYKMKKVRTDEENVPLYYLALFSRHPLAYKLWDQVLKYSTDQTNLFPE